ncbi:MAG: hypothetical protein JNM17_26650 [Archangium sp.]|nr:hypothetical protein [Archangium sp.]
MRWTLAVLIAFSSCKPPSELTAQEAEFARELTELKDIKANLEARRAEQVALQAELDGWKTDLKVVKAIIGAKGTLVDDVVQIKGIMPGATAESGLRAYKTLFEKQPHLRVLNFSVSPSEVAFEAATCVMRPSPPGVGPRFVPRVPAFCSRACKDLAALALKERDEIEQLRTELGPVANIQELRDAVDFSRSLSKESPPTARSLALLDRLALTQWLHAPRMVSFLMDGPQAQLLVEPIPTLPSGENISIDECNTRFAGLAECREIVDSLEITELASLVPEPDAGVE